MRRKVAENRPKPDGNHFASVYAVLSTKHNLLNIKILPKRKRRNAFSVTWKRLFHSAGKPI